MCMITLLSCGSDNESTNFFSDNAFQDQPAEPFEFDFSEVQENLENVSAQPIPTLTSLGKTSAEVTTELQIILSLMGTILNDLEKSFTDQIADEDVDGLSDISVTGQPVEINGPEGGTCYGGLNYTGSTNLNDRNIQSLDKLLDGVCEGYTRAITFNQDTDEEEVLNYIINGRVNLDVENEVELRNTILGNRYFQSYNSRTELTVFISSPYNAAISLIETSVAEGALNGATSETIQTAIIDSGLRYECRYRVGGSGTQVDTLTCNTFVPD